MANFLPIGQENDVTGERRMWTSVLNLLDLITDHNTEINFHETIDDWKDTDLKQALELALYYAENTYVPDEIGMTTITELLVRAAVQGEAYEV